MYTLKTFYKSKEWENLVAILKLERINKKDGILYCEHCQKPLIHKYDIIGHHKTELTEANVNDVNISLNPDNIVLIHFKCHNEIHQRFGFEQQKVYIVYGSPLAGKTTFVKENSSKDDIILDMDNIYNMINFNNSKYVKSNRIKSNVFIIRDCILDMIKCRTGKWRNAWIIGGYPLPMDRKRLMDATGAELIHIDTSKEECLKRLYNDPERQQVIAQWEQYINDYFNKYKED